MVVLLNECPWFPIFILYAHSKGLAMNCLGGYPCPGHTRQVDLRNFLLWSRLQVPQPTLPPPRSLGFSSTVRPSLGLKMSSIHTCARFDLHNRGLINVSDPSKSSVGATKLATVFHQCWPIAVFWAWRWGSCSRSWYLQPQCVLFEMTSYTNNFRRSLCMYLSRIASVSIYVFIYLFIWQSCGALS